jgi:hypothetical protein
MYGITVDDIREIDEKINKQIKFFSDNGLSAMGANVAPEKYLAELNNRVNALTKQSFEKNLKPVFITITCPSEYHPSSSVYKGYSVREANKKLYSIWNKVIQSRVMRESDYEYIQTKEPHKSGVPHLHAVFFIEEEKLQRFKRIFENEMKRQNIKQYKFKSEFESDKYKRKISAVVAYILKYIFKTFRNSKTGEMSLSAYWYVKHRIRRVTFSRTLVPLRVFRRINYRKEFQDMYKVTKDWFDGRIRETVKRLNIDYLYTDDNLEVQEVGLWIKPDQLISTIRKRFKVRYHEKFEPIIPIIIDGVKYQYNLVSQKVLKPSVCPALLPDWKLLNYYHSLDPEDENITLLHYGITKNECIRRGLISGTICSLNDFNIWF